MKPRIMLPILVSVLLLATPAAAKPHEPTGERICLHPWCGYTEYQEFPENEPFCIGHGRTIQPGDHWVHNFPDGMTGEHTFTGYWLATCQ